LQKNILAAAIALAAVSHIAGRAVAAPAGLPPATVHAGFGVNIHFTHAPAAEFARLQAVGVGFIRMDFQWAGIEKVRGVYDFSDYDSLCQNLNDAGIRPLYILDYGNGLYQKESPSTPAARDAFARFAAAAAKHFAGKGVIWEIWNEPNIGFWKPVPNATDYVSLAIATAKAVRAADPAATIVGPGSSTFDWQFFETIFKAGLLNYIDGVSVHPYRGGPPETVVTDWERLRGLIGRYAPAGKANLPMVSSEWGYATQTGGVSEQKQAQYLTRMWLTNLASGVNVSIYYDWKEDGVSPTDPEHHFGTVRPDLSPKPAYVAAQNLTRELRGYSFRHRLAGKLNTDWRMLFQRGDTADLALVTWDAAAAAPSAAQMPTVRKVGRADDDFPTLLHLAAVRFAPGPRAVARGVAAALTVTVVNPDDHAATVTVALRPEQKAVTSDATSRAKSFSEASATFSAGGRATLSARAGADAGNGTYAPEIRWNGQLLPAVMPVSVVVSDPLTMTAAPIGERLRVTVENPAGKAFAGTLSGDGATEKKPIAFSSGQTSIALDFPLAVADRLTQFAVRDGKTGKIVVQTDPARYVPMPGFPVRPATQTEFKRIDFIENAPAAEKPSVAAVSGSEYASSTALRFDYHFDPGWRYSAVVPPQVAELIPAGAQAFTMYVREDGTGNALRARFGDASGQVFQPDLGRLVGSGWRLIQIRLDGKDMAHWGGDNSGNPKPPLRWQGLILVDSIDKTSPKSGSVLVSSPYYVFGAPAERPAATH
jgi:hypothetical protein